MEKSEELRYRMPRRPNRRCNHRHPILGMGRCVVHHLRNVHSGLDI